MITLSPAERAVLAACEQRRTHRELALEFPGDGERLEELDATLDFVSRAGWLERYKVPSGDYLYKRTGAGTRVYRAQFANA